MHYHTFALKPLSAEIRKLFAGQLLVEAFSQNRNELILAFESGVLRVGCHTPHIYLLPENRFDRARKNVVDLFPTLSGEKLTDCYTVPYERVVMLSFANGQQLALKLHGMQSNVLLVEAGKVTALFNNSIEKDWTWEELPGKMESLESEVWSLESEATFGLQTLDFLKTISPVFEKRFAAKFDALCTEKRDVKAAFAALMRETESDTYYLVRGRNGVELWLFRPWDDREAVAIRGIVPAVQACMRSLFQFEAYNGMYRQAGETLLTPHRQATGLYASSLRTIEHLEAERSPEELGHLLMANLHRIESDMKAIVCDDLFGDMAPVTIKLQPDLSPQENAARYYAKHRERKLRLAHFYRQAGELEAKIAATAVAAAALEALPAPAALALTPEGLDNAPVRALRKLLKDSIPKENSAVASPFHTFEMEGWQIYVGRNAKNNDELTLHFARRDDLWLHAKDVTGSHVIIRAQGARTIPINVIEYAASIAAYNSRMRTSDLVPVQYTQRKYVRKRKGDPPGAVVVERENVMMVEPTL